MLDQSTVQRLQPQFGPRSSSCTWP